MENVNMQILKIFILLYYVGHGSPRAGSSVRNSFTPQRTEGVDPGKLGGIKGGEI